MIITVTGHRPQRLGQYDPGRLVDLAVAILARHQPDRIITGMAIGWDMAVAQAAVKLNVPFTAAVPFIGQEERWSESDQKLYRDLLLDAEQPVQVIGNHRKWREAFHARNRWMIDQGPNLVVALFDGQRYGGTWHTIQYAQAKNVRVINLWSSWQKGKAPPQS